MVYDRTDVKRKMSQVAPDLIDDVDLTIPIGLSHSWFAGCRLYKALRWIDDCQGFSDWDAALHWLATFKAPLRIRQVQIWGHGSPGKSWMAGDALTHATPFTDARGLLLHKIAERLTDNGVIWFRNCSVFAGARGHAFAKAWVNELDCRVAAHTHIIGPFQSGLHSLGPGQEPDWPADEGVVEGTAERPTKIAGSRPWHKNTVTMLKSEVPHGW